ncbi:MAG: M16 family metallopeptidase [Planctomycetota bacterium]|jgi:zinc protease
MIITRKTMLPALALAVATASVVVSAAPLPSDARIKSGKLANGLTWMYRKHDVPPGKMGFNLHVRTGSLNETDAQQGLAHFMEHMCFNGTDNFAPGELIPYFESIGMQFGQHLNAFTSFDQTVYMLFTPDTEAAQIDKALMVMSDYAFRCLLLDEEINKERGVVLEESRRGKGPFERLRNKVWPELFAGTRFANRLPIGKDDIIANAPQKEFVDYYRTWYRPENMTLVMVGDADPEPFIQMIEKWFGQYKAEVPARKQESAEFKTFTKQNAIVASDPEMKWCSIQITNMADGRPPTTTTEQARVDLVEGIGSWIIGRRFDERVNKGEASYLSAGASVFDFFNDGLMISGTARGEPDVWDKMLEEVVVEINRAREHGFTQREFELASKEIIADAERAVKTESTRNARGIMSGITSSVNNREPYMSAQQNLDMLGELLPSVTVEEVSKAFNNHFKPGTFSYVVQMPEKEDVAIPSRDDVLATARAAWSRQVEPIKEDSTPTTLLAYEPRPGKLTEMETDSDLGITSGWLSNGIRVHHRFMDYKKDSVLVTISLAGGEIEESEATAGVSSVATMAINDGATSRLTATNIRDIMTGANISVGAGSGGDTFGIRVSGSPEDLELGLQRAHAALTDGKIEQAIFDNWQQGMLQQLAMVQTMPPFKAQEALSELISGGDPRQTMMTPERVESQTIERAQAWYERLCMMAPIEVAIVGDISLQDCTPLIEKYIGSLPQRNRSAAHLDGLRKLARATGPLQRHVEVETVTPQAMGIAGFMGCNGRSTFDRRGLSLAQNILSSRLVKRVREDLGIVYSIRAGSRPSWTYEDSGTFMAAAPCDPNNADQLTDEVHKMFRSFADDGPTDEELANAKKQIAEQLDTSMREPNFWLSILRTHDLHGRNFKEAKTVVDDYQKYTAAQVQGIFKKYYNPTRQFSVTAVPVKPQPSKDQGKEKVKGKAGSPAS